MPIKKWDPFQDILSIHQAIFGDGAELGLAESTRTAWAPPVDVFETERAYVLKAELPGMEADQITLEYRDKRLTIQGEKIPEKKEDAKHHLVERVYGSFKRTFILPDCVSCEHIEANYEDGVLEIVVPKRSEEKSRAISVKSE